MTTETPEGLDFEIRHGEPVDDTDDQQPAAEDTGTTPSEDPQEAPQEGEDDAEESKATRLRKRAQDAERERDHLREQLDATRRALVEQASTRMYKPAALWAAGNNVDDLFGDDGSLDPAALDAAINHTARTLGVPLRPKPDPSQGIGSQVRHEEASWDSALHPHTS